MSTFQVIQNGAVVEAIECDETRAFVNARLFPTRRVARRWVLERLDADVRAEQASIRNQILRLHLAA